MAKPKGSIGSIKQALYAVLTDPRSTPRDKIAASDRLARLIKRKPRVPYARKAKEEGRDAQRQSVEPDEQAISANTEDAADSPAERLAQLSAACADYMDEWEAEERARIARLSSMRLTPSESAQLKAALERDINPCVVMDAWSRAKSEEGIRLRFLEELERARSLGA